MNTSKRHMRCKTITLGVVVLGGQDEYMVDRHNKKDAHPHRYIE